MGFPYASQESLRNIRMLDWEIRRIESLLEKGPATEDQLTEETEAVLNEVELVKRLDGLPDVREALKKASEKCAELLKRITAGGGKQPRKRTAIDHPPKKPKRRKRR